MTEPPSSPRVNPRLLLVLAGVSGVVLGFLLLQTVFGGQGDQAVKPSQSLRTAAPVTSGADVPASTAPTSVPAPSRDPFVQIVTVPPAGQSGDPAPSAQAAPSGGGSPAPEPASPEPDPPMPASAPAAPPSVASGSDASGAAQSAGFASLELTSIFRDGSGVERATIVVDGQSYSPARGEVFSYGFRLAEITAGCVEVWADAAHARMCLPAGSP